MTRRRITIWLAVVETACWAAILGLGVLAYSILG